MIKQVLLFSFLLSLGLLPHTSEMNSEWEFKKEKEGIKIFTRESKESNIKELKITFRLEASLSSIVALISNVDAYQNWVYRCSMSKTLKKINDFESFDYYRVDFPWPLSDRDMVVLTKIEQDANTKVITALTTCRPEVAEKVDDFIRITDHTNQWIFTPISSNITDVHYTLKSDPAGNIPSWLVNMAIDQGPVQTMMRLRKILKSDEYRHKQVAGITNY